jgi:DNA-binding CsgD family transcriptional regulator
LIANEYSTKEIVDYLFINFETVKSHIRNLFVKLNIKNVAGLVSVAFEKKVLSA